MLLKEEVENEEVNSLRNGITNDNLTSTRYPKSCNEIDSGTQSTYISGLLSLQTQCFLRLFLKPFKKDRNILHLSMIL